VIADGLQRAGQQINAGESMSEAFHNLGMFPPLVIRMLRVGETTGALDTALMNVTYFYNRDVRDSVDKALKLLEPTLTLILGGMLALILFSVLTPVYDVIGKLKL
jgi:type IV pilus assembly protein PilC